MKLAPGLPPRFSGTCGGKKLRLVGKEAFFVVCFFAVVSHRGGFVEADGNGHAAAVKYLVEGLHLRPGDARKQRRRKTRERHDRASTPRDENMNELCLPWPLSNMFIFVGCS